MYHTKTLLLEEMSNKTGCVFPWLCQMDTCTTARCPEKMENISRNGTEPLFNMFKDVANNKYVLNTSNKPNKIGFEKKIDLL